MNSFGPRSSRTFTNIAKNSLPPPNLQASLSTITTITVPLSIISWELEADLHSGLARLQCAKSRLAAPPKSSAFSASNFVQLLLTNIHSLLTTTTLITTTTMSSHEMELDGGDFGGDGSNDRKKKVRELIRLSNQIVTSLLTFWRGAISQLVPLLTEALQSSVLLLYSSIQQRANSLFFCRSARHQLQSPHL